MTPETTFEVGQRVKVTWQDSELLGTFGIVYWHEPSRPCPWHVRPDGWPADVPGVAFKTEELAEEGES